MNIALHMPNARRLAWWTTELRELLPELLSEWHTLFAASSKRDSSAAE